jgi:hypothetical protein
MESHNRRKFLATTTSSIVGGLIASEAFATTRPLSNVASALQPDDKPQPINAISLGFYNPQLEHLLKVVPTDISKMSESQRTIKSMPNTQAAETIKLTATKQDLSTANKQVSTMRQKGKVEPQDLSELKAPPAFTFKNNIRNAKFLSAGDPAFVQKKARVDFNGMFVAKDNWAKNDQGSLMVKIGFDKFKNTQTCQEISDATVGGAFTVPFVNSIVPAFSGDQIIIDTCGVEGGLKLSFNLVDVFDNTDRGLAGKILAAVKELSDFHGTGKIINAFLPYVTAGSKILDIFGSQVLNTSEEDKQLWSFTQEAILETGSGLFRHKLLPGFYFVGGFSKFEKENGSQDGLPDWKNYMVNGPEGMGGNPFLLLRLKDGKPIPVDFSYVVIGVSYAS